ncbi:MAG: hypothetical protein KME17_08620 [Cyanosarcina radialis HA8281-LM2]|jgi:ribosomal protein L37AE/L43A|nr:hypothetical protein [Cyanosarcina radialis HA8281-LM2]
MNHTHTDACPLCSHLLLRHIRSNEIYWFCRHCHQEVPVVRCKSQMLTLKVADLRKQLAYAS